MDLFSSRPESESLAPPRTDFSCYSKYVGGFIQLPSGKGFVSEKSIETIFPNRPLCWQENREPKD